MTNKPKLNPKVLEFLQQKLNKSKATIRSEISVLKRAYHDSTLNAVAQIYAEQHGESVRRLIGKEDKLTIPSFTVDKPKVLKSKSKGNLRENIKTIVHFETNDPFLKKHIDEINRAYTKACYTCVFVLVRKVFENLIIGILKAKYPANRELYFDSTKNRNLDFSVVLESLYKKRNDFGSDTTQVIERLNQKLKPFKHDANDKVHSLYHIVENANEIDDWNVDTIFALIKEIQ